MTLRSVLIGLAAVASIAGAVPAASAQGIIIDQGGVRIAPPPGYDDGGQRGYDRGPQYNHRGISPREASRIARGAGMAQTYDVGRRGPMWVVSGADRRGRGLIVTISSRTGDIVNVNRQGRG
ncbi:PepSY domain-containing protein [Kaistia dalseonensis]|uniref:Antifreeze protein n=1 Tax=Kaistia dalseonensis TaxID=410840 RepID=A0ABU0H6Y8_9HYPH|nr:PepSY domain-containing protein [Kaistia dalseonensis]MCX5495490.1 PepSY domain-containing protein [Kaistia dalseonensis]MDQ0438081.1 hypothetical protein [Kaistia dalseonensis]